MGNYLNSLIPLKTYSREWGSPYFVDKSRMLGDVIGRIQTSMNYICITRPRRFGKSVMANMIASYFSKTGNAGEVFDRLEIGRDARHQTQCGQYDVIFISFNELPKKCQSYGQYVDRIEKRLLDDLMNEYPAAKICSEDAVWDALTAVYNAYDCKQFIFVFDEWDFIFHRDFVAETDKKEYISFLSNLLKDKIYVALAYMTGILPIAKYSSGSELNMFAEYTMISEELYSECFGFTDQEVDKLYARYLKNQPKPSVTRDGLREWYDGYHTKSGERVYNPRSVVMALTNNNLGNYWTSSGPYDMWILFSTRNLIGKPMASFWS